MDDSIPSGQPTQILNPAGEVEDEASKKEQEQNGPKQLMVRDFPAYDITVEEKSTEIPADEDEKSDPVAASPNDPLLQVEQQEHLGEVEQHQKITSSNK